MWDWNRAIVAPLATEGFAKALRTQRNAYEASTAAALDDDQPYEASTAVGRLGSVWGYVPRRSDYTHVRLNPPQP